MLGGIERSALYGTVCGFGEELVRVHGDDETRSWQTPEVDDQLPCALSLLSLDHRGAVLMPKNGVADLARLGKGFER